MKPSAGWTTYGTSRAVFSSFQGVTAATWTTPAENVEQTFQFASAPTNDPSRKTRANWKVCSTFSLSLIDRNIFQIRFAQVLRAWADQFIVAKLFEHMGRPTGDTADREDRRVKVNRDTQHVIGRSRIKIHIGANLLAFFIHLGDDEVFDSLRHIEPFGVALAFARRFGHAAQMGRARV